MEVIGIIDSPKMISNVIFDFQNYELGRGFE